MNQKIEPSYHPSPSLKNSKGRKSSKTLSLIIAVVIVGSTLSILGGTFRGIPGVGQPQTAPQFSDTVFATIGGFNKPFPLAYNPIDHNMYVGNAGSNTVSVIDSSTNTIVRTITAGTHPQGIAFNPNGLMYVTNGGDPCNPCDDTLLAIDPQTGSILKTVPVDGNPVGVVFNPSNNEIYVAASGKPGVVCTCDGHVFVFDSTTYTQVTVIPGAFAARVAYNPSDHNIWLIEGSDAATVAVISSSTNTITATITVPNDPGFLSYNPFNTKMYVTSHIPSAVSVIDSSTKQVTSSITVNDAEGVAYNPANNDVYVTSFAGNTVSRVNSSTNAVGPTLQVGANPVDIAFDPANEEMYVPNVGGTTVSVIGTPLQFTASALATTAEGRIPLIMSFTATATGGLAPYTFSWTFGDGSTSSQQNPTHVYTTPGRFSVSLTITDSQGNTATKNVATINASVEPAVNQPSVFSQLWFWGIITAVAATTAAVSALVVTKAKPPPATLPPRVNAEKAVLTCPSCGTELPKGSAFCGKCGRKTEVKG